MKKSILVLTTFVMLILISCSKEDKESPDNDGSSVKVPTKSINGHMKKLLHYNNPEDDIYHTFGDYDLGVGSIKIGDGLTMDFIIATGSVNETGGVSLAFTTEIPNDQLTQMYKHSGNIQTSPSNLRTTWHLTNLELTPEASQHAPKNPMEYISELPVYNDYAFETVIYSFVCAEMDGSITGTLNAGHTVNMNLKKGWNILKIATSENVKKVEVVDIIPSDAFFHYGWVSHY